MELGHLWSNLTVAGQHRSPCQIVIGKSPGFTLFLTILPTKRLMKGASLLFQFIPNLNVGAILLDVGIKALKFAILGVEEKPTMV